MKNPDLPEEQPEVILPDVVIRCRQTGFTTKMPGAEWAKYPDGHKALYEVLGDK